ncbi:MAG: fibronectin type III domain-containing protein [Eubacterium sp.]
MKKIISIALALTMLVCATAGIQVNAYAADNTDISNAEQLSFNPVSSFTLDYCAEDNEDDRTDYYYYKFKPTNNYETIYDLSLQTNADDKIITVRFLDDVKITSSTVEYTIRYEYTVDSNSKKNLELLFDNHLCIYNLDENIGYELNPKQECYIEVEIESSKVSDNDYIELSFSEHKHNFKEDPSLEGFICPKCGVEICYWELISVTNSYPTYNGKVKIPKVKVEDPYGNIIPSSNYELSYPKIVNAGYYKVNVKVNSPYKCSIDEPFVVKPASSKNNKVSLSKTTYTYDGKTHKPAVTVKTSSGKKLSAGTDYKLVYASGLKNVGKYSVKVDYKGNYYKNCALKYERGAALVSYALGNYNGTKTMYFTIKPKGTSISSVSAKSKGFTVKWKKQATQTTGYQIQYSTSSKFTNAKTVTVSSNKTTSKTIKKLKSKKKYYVRVRAYKTVGKTKYYSSWSKTKTVTTKK